MSGETTVRNGRVVLPESVPRTPALIAAAKLEVTINDRLGVETDPVIRELARSQPNSFEGYHRMRTSADSAP